MSLADFSGGLAFVLFLVALIEERPSWFESWRSRSSTFPSYLLCQRWFKSSEIFSLNSCALYIGEYAGIITPFNSPFTSANNWISSTDIVQEQDVNTKTVIKHTWKWSYATRGSFYWEKITATLMCQGWEPQRAWIVWSTRKFLFQMWSA